MHIGEFIAHERLLYCNHCDCETVYASSDLAKLVERRCSFGYDVMVYIGRALFLRHRCNREIIDELAVKNIRISPSEIDYLGRKFIIYLAVAHQQSAGRIREAMQLKGGYMLHVDGTFDTTGPMLMSGLDSITEIVLGNVKIPSEKAAKIIPFLRRIARLFGQPLAVVIDMGRGIMKAVEEVFADIPFFICHFHFLRDIGKDLFGKEYAIIRNRLKKHQITATLRRRARLLREIIDENPSLINALDASIKNKQLSGSTFWLISIVSAYSLIQWALDGKNQAQGYGFPFDQPHVTFARRLRIVYDNIERLTTLKLPNAKYNNTPFIKVARDLKDVVNDTVLWEKMLEIESKIEVFDRLRDAMRIATKSGCQGLNCDGMEENIYTIEKRVTDFRRWLTTNTRFSTHHDYKKLIAQIDKYWEKLFADPIDINTPSGKVSIQPQRTNNILERFFRDFRRGNRRKTGNSSMSKMLKAMLAETPLVKNLENRDYMDILLNGKKTLEELFADIDATMVRRNLQQAQKSCEKIPAKIKKMIALPVFPEIISDIFVKGIQN